MLAANAQMICPLHPQRVVDSLAAMRDAVVNIETIQRVKIRSFTYVVDKILHHTQQNNCESLTHLTISFYALAVYVLHDNLWCCYKLVAVR